MPRGAQGREGALRSKVGGRLEREHMTGMRQGLVLDEKKSSSSGRYQAPWIPLEDPFSSLVGSVLRNNVLEAVGPLAVLWEVPGPPQSQKQQPLLQPHRSATNSEKQEFRSRSSLHGPNLIANLLPLPNP